MKTLAWLLLLTTTTARAADAPVSALCATPAQAAESRRLLGEPRANYWGVAEKLGTTEAAVLSAVAAERGAATSGAAFARVWESVRGWRDAVTLVMKSGHVFEIHGAVNEGSRSTQSRYFNLRGEAGLTGHLRPDRIAAIYAVDLPGRNGREYGVAFADATGTVAFAIYLPAGDDARADDLKSWEATRALIGAQAPLCPPSP